MMKLFKVIPALSALLFGAGIVLSTAASAAEDGESSAVASIDFLEGTWRILDAEGKEIGRSVITVQFPGAMLFEKRTIGEGKPLLMWLANSEKYGGWTQLFVSPAGIREFPPQSAPGKWPLVMGAPVTLQSGKDVVFRLTISRDSDDKTRRVLEMSRDDGGTWQTFFDYTYVRMQE